MLCMLCSALLCMLYQAVLYAGRVLHGPIAHAGACSNSACSNFACFYCACTVPCLAMDWAASAAVVCPVLHAHDPIRPMNAPVHALQLLSACQLYAIALVIASVLRDLVVQRSKLRLRITAECETKKSNLLCSIPCNCAGCNCSCNINCISRVAQIEHTVQCHNHSPRPTQYN